ncbi:MAG TPA: ATP-binding protein, partial [Solirubrobacterales bacterium]|nr:ATP-binding protein [Solirubrobacterales bacterium]
GDPEQDPLERVDDEGFVQVLAPDGTVADATTDALLSEPLLSPQEVTRLTSGQSQRIDSAVDDLNGEELRLIADFARDDGRRYTTIVAASLESRNETLSSLSRILLIGGPIGLLLASAFAYLLVSAALRPVEAMRARAAQITGPRRGERLPVPPARDEIANLGETLNEMLARIERAFERERSFVSDASHELRTPLSILKAELDLALAAGRTPEELSDAIRSAADETNRLVKLADDLLVLARADEGRLPLEPERIDAHELLERIAERFSPAASALDRKVEATNGPALSFRADPARIEQAISNLVQNALSHGSGTVSLSAEPNDEGIEFHVRDQGAGLPPELLDTAFERFSRGNGRTAGGGTGLGLAIVAAIAEAHGGSSHLGTSNNGGADAWIRLPAS